MIIFVRVGTKFFVVPGEHGFSSFQVENVHWKCMCAAHKCFIKINKNKNKNKIYLRSHEFVRKKQNGGWKVSDADWFYFSFYDPNCLFLWSEFIWVQCYFIFIFLFDPSWSESIRVDPTWTGGPSWSGPTFVPGCFFCLCETKTKCYLEAEILKNEISDPLQISVSPSNEHFRQKAPPLPDT